MFFFFFLVAIMILLSLLIDICYHHCARSEKKNSYRLYLFLAVLPSTVEFVQIFF